MLLVKLIRRLILLLAGGREESEWSEAGRVAGPITRLTYFDEYYYDIGGMWHRHGHKDLKKLCRVPVPGHSDDFGPRGRAGRSGGCPLFTRLREVKRRVSLFISPPK